MMGDVLETARHQGYLNTIVTTAPEVTRYLVEHSSQVQPDAHNTVKTHLKPIYQKLGVSSRAEAIERAVDLQLI